jgi:hypothetical protein
MEDAEMVHVRFEGRSFDLDERQLRLAAVPMPSDIEIKARIAGHLDIAPARLDNYIVDRTIGGGLVVRPEAVYG